MFRGKCHDRVKLGTKLDLKSGTRRIFGYIHVVFPNGVDDLLECIVDTGATRTVIPRVFWESAAPLEPYSFPLGKCEVVLPLSDSRPYVLLGLGGGTLDKGGLCINWKEKLVYFVEVEDVPHM